MSCGKDPTSETQLWGRVMLAAKCHLGCWPLDDLPGVVFNTNEATTEDTAQKSDQEKEPIRIELLLWHGATVTTGRWRFPVVRPGLSTAGTWRGQGQFHFNESGEELW